MTLDKNQILLRDRTESALEKLKDFSPETKEYTLAVANTVKLYGLKQSDEKNDAEILKHEVEREKNENAAKNEERKIELEREKLKATSEIEKAKLTLEREKLENQIANERVRTEIEKQQIDLEREKLKESKIATRGNWIAKGIGALVALLGLGAAIHFEEEGRFTGLVSKGAVSELFKMIR